MSSMDRIEALFHAARELPPGDREEFLEAAAGREDHATVERVRALLVALDAVSDEETSPTASVAGLEADRAAALLRWAGDSAEEAGSGWEPGERVGRYGIVRRLGEGGMGAVYLAHDPVLDRHVALKFLPPDLYDPERLLEEARTASSLDHPCIGTVYAVDRDEHGHHFLAMASYEGGTLRDRLREGPLPIDDAVQVAVQVADALHMAHENGIVHRDVKPENLVFDESGRVKIVDFGIAHALRRGGRSGSTGGTTAYMSPEQIQGQVIDGRADLWSLGVVLYEMLAGRRPFDGPDRGALLQKIQEADPPPIDSWRDDVPPALAAAIARAVSPDPADRPETGKEFATALRDATSPAPSFGKELRGPRGRKAAAWLAGGAVMVFLAGVLVAREMPRVIEASGWAGPAFTERGEVVVADFEAADGLAELALAAREALVVDLQQSGFVTVAGHTRVAGILERMGHSLETPVEGALAREVAERAGAGAVISATIARAGSRYVLSARALHPASGEELFSVRTSAGERRLLGAVERLSREIRLRLGETGEGLATSRPLPEVTTPSIEALRMYAEAERWLSRDNERAAAFLRAAVEIDPEFAMAHRLAGSVAVNRLRFSEAATHLELAWEHRERLPDRERWQVEAMHASEAAFEPWRAAELYERVLARFPNDYRAAANLGATRMSWLGDPEGAHLAWRQALSDADNLGPLLMNSVYSAVLFGDLDEADRLAEHSEATGFEGSVARWHVARSFALADHDGTAGNCAMLLEAGFPPLAMADDREVCGSMAVANGDLDLAVSLLESVLPEYVRDGRHRNVAHVSQALATADLLAGDTTSARNRLMDAMDQLPAEELAEPDRFITRQNLRIQAALFGWTDVEQRAAARYPPYSDPEHWFGRAGERLVLAAKAVHAGDGEEALEVLDSAFPQGVMAIGWRTFDELLRGRAHEAMGNHDHAAVHFERAADRTWALYPVLTKDRMNIPLALEGLERVGRVATRSLEDEG